MRRQEGLHELVRQLLVPWMAVLDFKAEAHWSQAWTNDWIVVSCEFFDNTEEWRFDISDHLILLDSNKWIHVKLNCFLVYMVH